MIQQSVIRIFLNQWFTFERGTNQVIGYFRSHFGMKNSLVTLCCILRECGKCDHVPSLRSFNAFLIPSTPGCIRFWVAWLCSYVDGQFQKQMLGDIYFNPLLLCYTIPQDSCHSNYQVLSHHPLDFKSDRLCGSIVIYFSYIECMTRHIDLKYRINGASLMHQDLEDLHEYLLPPQQMFIFIWF